MKVDLNSIRKNILKYKSNLSEARKICAVVKADCYGLGSKIICREIDECVDYFAVSSEGEFLEIQNIVSKPVILLTPIYENITLLAGYGLEFCVSNKTQFERFLIFAKQNINIKIKIHIAVNTGMNRYGFSKISDIFEIVNKCQKTQNISIIGVFSHFYMGNNKNISNFQLHKLTEIKNCLSDKFDISQIIFHIANTDGFFVGKCLDMVRVGIGMFLNHNKTSFELTSKIIEIQSLKINETAGYALNFIASKNMQVAVVGVGYADGVFKNIAGKGFVLINGVFSKILAVCMDCLIVDVTNLNASINDVVVLIGKSGNNQIFVCDVAMWCDTIEHEIMAKISKRVKRIYVGERKCKS